MVEYLTPNVIYTPASAYARVAATTRPDLLPTWNGPVPFDNHPALVGPLSGGASPGNVLVEFERLITLPDGTDCYVETVKEVYLYSRRPIAASEVTAPDGWTVLEVPPYGGAVTARGHGLLVLVAPEEFAGRTVRFTCPRPLSRVLGMATVRDIEFLSGADVFLADDAGNHLLLDDGNLMQDAYE